ncbi:MULTISPECIES: LamG-like jellyroll fold domain-containing protein [unclassified Acinetobacter]|uniref:LamG-like jellyroll fold domain-containing protein n=1 Tax=unclassified Acinetobacter TaxID=196816 RepID=UPI002575F1DE|nr:MULTISPECIES: LamG-like jellyroll fold domain-containing protein [unclassified Acinetobacter]MDM1757194.1 hypothetical protein [Acinetobacter sp. 256-1]MDM1760021.1 hypothetical protein [Acinetobacter sp. 251-1]
MAGIRIEWGHFGHFDSFDVIRSNTSLANVSDANLPEPIMTGLKSMYYVDTTFVLGRTAYYKIRAWQGVNYIVSDEIKLKDIYFDKVELLLLANVPIYPSTNITDKSSYARSLTFSGVTIVSSLQTIDGGSFDFSNTSGIRYIQAASIPSLNLDDFTIEFFAKINSYTSVYHRVLIFDTQEIVSTGALQLQLADNGTFRWYINNGTIRQGGISSSAVGTELKHHCLMRKNGIFYYYIDGLLQSTYDQFLKYSITKNNFRLGGYSSNLIGYISSLRITRAVRYNIEGFTPPSEMFTNY